MGVFVAGYDDPNESRRHAVEIVGVFDNERAANRALADFQREFIINDWNCFVEEHDVAGAWETPEWMDHPSELLGGGA